MTDAHIRRELRMIVDTLLVIFGAAFVYLLLSATTSPAAPPQDPDAAAPRMGCGYQGSLEYKLGKGFGFCEDLQQEAPRDI